MDQMYYILYAEKNSFLSAKKIKALANHVVCQSILQIYLIGIENKKRMLFFNLD